MWDLCPDHDHSMDFEHAWPGGVVHGVPVGSPLAFVVCFNLTCTDGIASNHIEPTIVRLPLTCSFLCVTADDVAFLALSAMTNQRVACWRYSSARHATVSRPTCFALTVIRAVMTGSTVALEHFCLSIVGKRLSFVCGFICFGGSTLIAVQP